MKILLNGREEEFGTEKISVTEMIDLSKFSFRMRIIKMNDRLFEKEKFDSTYINDVDNDQMLYLMSGG
jgi:hypothetical protein